jgi:hypothetical protein
MKILLRYFNAKVGREDIFKPVIGNECLHEASNDKEVRVVNFATSKYLIVKSTTFPHRDIHKHTWISPDGVTHNQADHVLETLTNQNDIHYEIKSRLNSRNACYYSVQNLLSSRLISKNLKIKIYKTVILPVVLYG